MTTWIDFVEPYRAVEVDGNHLAARVAAYPAYNRPNSFSWSAVATNLAQTTTAYAFAFRNTSSQYLKVIRYMRFDLEDDLATRPLAAVEYGMHLRTLRRWTQDVIATAGPDSFIPEPTARGKQRMMQSQTARLVSAVGVPYPDIRIAGGGTSTSVVNSFEQFEPDANSFMESHGWHLAAAASVEKTLQRMEFDARQPGLYPLVLEQWDGIALRPRVTTWDDMALTVHIEWDEVLYDEWDTYPFSGK